MCSKLPKQNREKNETKLTSHRSYNPILFVLTGIANSIHLTYPRSYIIHNEQFPIQLLQYKKISKMSWKTCLTNFIKQQQCCYTLSCSESERQKLVSSLTAHACDLIFRNSHSSLGNKGGFQNPVTIWQLDWNSSCLNSQVRETAPLKHSHS